MFACICSEAYLVTKKKKKISKWFCTIINKPTQLTRPNIILILIHQHRHLIQTIHSTSFARCLKVASSSIIVCLAVRHWRNAGRTLVWCRGNAGPAWGRSREGSFGYGSRSIYTRSSLGRPNSIYWIQMWEGRQNEGCCCPSDSCSLVLFHTWKDSRRADVLLCLLCINTSYVCKYAIKRRSKQAYFYITNNTVQKFRVSKIF